MGTTSVTAYTHTCDGCGAAVVDASPRMPVGWIVARLSVDGHAGFLGTGDASGHQECFPKLAEAALGVLRERRRETEARAQVRR